MAKKKSSFSHIEAQQKLEQLRTTRETFGYDLLRIFCGYGEASIARIVDGRGNDARDGRTVLQKKLLAYRPQDSGGLFEGRDMYAELDDMRRDPKIAKKEPRLYVVSDGVSVVAYDPKEDDTYENEIALLWKDFEFFKPLAGIEKFRNIEEQEADVRSAEVMAKIYDDIRRYNDVRDKEQMHNLNIFMSRLLFCYFAEDTGLFPEPNMFTNAIKSGTKADGSDLAEFIEGIFDIMAIGDADIRAQKPDIVSRFPYVNGGLFKAHIPIPVLSRRTRALMLKCGDYDWKDINPDIFGSMIQAVVSPEERSGLGIHYTSVPNIMKVIRPLFLDALTEEYIRAKDNSKGLRALLTRLSRIKFFDPACGSGNFLIITYKRVRELEIEIWQRLQTLAGGQSEMPFSNILLTQFYGIELDEYACDTATLSLWLAEHQMNNIFYEKLGSRPDALPLRPSGHIVCGNACCLDWNEVCPHTPEDEVYIMGNPPYLGSSLQNKEQKKDKDIVFIGQKNYKDLDYIACWFYKGAQYIQTSKAQCAFVSTNSLCQGEQVSMLWRPVFNMDIEISFAYNSFLWGNNAKNKAAVFCIIVGLRSKSTEPKYIISNNTSRIVKNINGYLVEGICPYIEKLGKPISEIPIIRRGNSPTDNGELIFSTEEKDCLVKKYPYIEKYIKKYIGSIEFINDMERWILFANNDSYGILDKIPELHNRFEAIKIFRKNSKQPQTAALASFPLEYFYSSYQNTSCIIIPRVSSARRLYIPIGILNHDTVVADSAFNINNGELWAFAVFSSNIHLVWIKNIGGKLKSDYRYSSQLCYNTFPVPKLSNEQKEILEEHAENVLNTRELHTEMTLGEMYNPETMPLDLRLAHQALDAAVERCYRAEPFISDEERLEYLFKLYEKMTKKR